MTIISVAFSQMFYVPGSEWGKAFPNIPQSTTQVQPMAFMGGEPVYEAYQDVIASNPRYREVGQKVGRLDLLIDTPNGPSVGYCTATLIAVDKIITNRHCLHEDNPSLQVIGMELRMGFHSEAELGETFIVDVQAIEKNRPLDFAIFRVLGDPGDKYGTIKFDYRSPNGGEPLFLIHHSLGKPKMVTRINCRVFSSRKAEEIANQPVIGENVSYLPVTDVTHRCDSQMGSSGSLVFAQIDDKIVGLHFAGTNEELSPALRFNMFKKINKVVEASIVLKSLVNGDWNNTNGRDNNITINNGVAMDVGTLTLDTIPSGATVYVNDKEIGVTPLSNYQLSIGDYNLKLALWGYQEVTGQFTIGKDKVTSSEIKLQVIAPLSSLPTQRRGVISIKRNSDWIPILEDIEGTRMALVPVGSFKIGSDNGDDDEKNGNVVKIDEPFWIDETEVTRAAYASCEEADSRCSQPDKSSFATSVNHPINNVTWDQAAAYCDWRGARLPTEAEWEYVARGPDRWIYSWGNVWDAAKTQSYESSNYGTVAVGTYEDGKSWVGALDITGNVLEWTSSKYENYPYNYNNVMTIEEYKKRLPGAVVLRGSSYMDDAALSHSANREKIRISVDFTDDSVGFRCARSDF